MNCSGHSNNKASGLGRRKLLAVLVAGCVAGPVAALPDSPGFEDPYQLAAPDQNAPTVVEAIRVGLDGDRTRLVFDVSNAPRGIRVDSASSGNGIVVTLDAAEWQGELPQQFPGDALVAVVPTKTGEGVTVAVETEGPPVRVEHFTLAPSNGRGHRLVIDLYPGETAVAGEHGSRPVEGGFAGTMSYNDSVVPAAVDDGDDLLFRFEDDGSPMEEGSAASWFGYGEFSSAYTVASPSRWSQLRGRFELGTSGDLGTSARYRLVGRVEGDAAYSVESDYYDSAVRRDQRRDAAIREAYIDFPTGAWEWRLGRQHVVWGEMVGLFLADVVSARDMREFYLQEFENMRIPQWAVRSEYFSGNSHFEMLWIPYPSYDEIGKPGADFYPFPVPAGTPVRTERPSRNLSNTNAGIRFSHLVSGWDLSVFHYQSMDVQPTLYQTDNGLELRNDRIRQTGGTFSKAMPTFVFKGEAVYTSGRKYLSDDPSSRYGLESSDSLEYVVGVMVPWNDWRFDFQFYGGYLFGYERGILRDQSETGVTLLLNHELNDRLEWEILYLTGLNRTDYSIQPKVTWNLTQQWRMQFGADFFGGGEVGLFGLYDNSDRVYLELRRWF